MERANDEQVKSRVRPCDDEPRESGGHRQTRIGPTLAGPDRRRCSRTVAQCVRPLAGHRREWSSRRVRERPPRAERFDHAIDLITFKADRTLKFEPGANHGAVGRCSVEEKLTALCRGMTT